MYLQINLNVCSLTNIMSTYEIPTEKSMLKICHSTYETQFPTVFSQSACKSDVILTSNREKNNHGKQLPLSTMGFSEYCKKFDYEAMVMKYIPADSNSEIVLSRKECLTNSDLDKLEEKLNKNISAEGIVNDGSFSSLDSNIKYLRTTIEQVFDSFHKNMKDYEIYKEKYYEIIAKNREDFVAEMEDFITDMLQHINISSESDLNNCENGPKRTIEEKEINRSNYQKPEDNFERNKSLKAANSTCTLEICKSNDNLTYSMPAEDEKVQKNENVSVLNAFLPSNWPNVEVKNINRNMFSEINITDTSERDDIKAEAASADNLRKVAEKKLELENYERSGRDYRSNHMQRNFPVKESRAKQNIINEDLVNYEDKGDVKSFISRICSYLCKKIRKNTFG